MSGFEVKSQHPTCHSWVKLEKSKEIRDRDRDMTQLFQQCPLDEITVVVLKWGITSGHRGLRAEEGQSSTLMGLI